MVKDEGANGKCIVRFEHPAPVGQPSPGWMEVGLTPCQSIMGTDQVLFLHLSE